MGESFPLSKGERLNPKIEGDIQHITLVIIQKKRCEIRLCEPILTRKLPHIDPPKQPPQTQASCGARCQGFEPAIS